MPVSSSQPLVRRAPEDLGIPSAALLALADRLQDEGLDPHALLIARGGEVAFEAAWAPYRLDRPVLVYSASKTFTSLAIGFLADEGRLGLDDSVGDLLGIANPHGITVRHLLTMNTGHTGAQIGAVDAVIAADADAADPRALLALEPAHAPGTFFAYNSPATHLLSTIVTALTGEALTAYLRPRLLDPLGIGDRWMRSVRGVEHGASGFHLTVDDLARTATMLGAGGVFAGRQVVPAWYVDEMSRPWSVTADFDGPASAEGEVNDWALGYGYQVWRGREGFRLDGAAGQFGLVLPEHDLVIAYQGATMDTQATLRAFWAFVDALEVAAAAGGPAAGGAPAVPDVPQDRDTWDARDRLVLMTEAPFDAAGLVLEDVADGWSLTIPGVGVLPVRTEWTETAVDADATRWSLATRGESRADGAVLIHIVDTTSPHRAIVRRGSDGRVEAGWHIPPLRGGWSALRVPPAVSGGR